MRILVVRKPTNFELHGERVGAQIGRGFWQASELDQLRRAHAEHYQCLERLYKNLSELGFSYRVVTRAEDWPSDFQADCVITIGGDGTLLSASHRLGEGTRLIGIRSSHASVGYTCTADTAGLDAMMRALAENRLEFVRVSRLKLRIAHADSGEVTETVPVLNDVLFANVNPAATTHYNIKLGAHEEVHKSSGIWISTAVGSTAGIAAAGGKALPLEDYRFQFKVRELYRARNSTYQLTEGVFDADKSPLVLGNRNEHALVALDGQHGEVELAFGDRIEFVRGSTIYLARPQERKGPIN